MPLLRWQYAQLWGPMSIFPWQHGQSAGRPLLSAVNLTSGQPGGFPRQSDRRPGQPRRSQGNQTGPGQADRFLSGSRSVLFRFCFLAFSASSRAVRPAVRNGFLARRPLGLPRTGHWNSPQEINVLSERRPAETLQRAFPPGSLLACTRSPAPPPVPLPAGTFRALPSNPPELPSKNTLSFSLVFWGPR